MAKHYRKRLFVDMDGTLARFHDQVNYLERMFEKDFFRSLAPFENMVAGVRQFIQEHPDVEVFVLSARVNGEPPYCEEEKNAWLDEQLPEVDLAHRIYTEVGKSKADYIPGVITQNDFLLDDYNKGLNLWLYDGGSAIKCHNNINQRGLGAYGGSAGMMWTGAMVHTEDTPEMIAAELASHMGLSYDLDKVLYSSHKEIEYTEFTPGSRLNPNPFVPDVDSYITKILPDKDNPERYEAKFTEPYYHKADFQNPLNAIRWLEGKADFYELQMQGTSGDKLSIPVIQANSLSSNLYGCSDYTELLDSGRFPSDVVDAFRSSLEESNLPIVGAVHYLGTDGTVGYTLTFHSVEEMQLEIHDSEECGRPITVDWFVQPRHTGKQITLETYPEHEPPAFSISPENLRLAASVCGFEIEDINEFLSDYTWDDSALIYEQYAQYIVMIADIMVSEGFASRAEVDEEFYDAMQSPDATPISAAKSILSNIEEWARWDNDEALKAGVMDMAIAARLSLDDEPAPVKASLAALISSARKQLSSSPQNTVPQSPER